MFMCILAAPLYKVVGEYVHVVGFQAIEELPNTSSVIHVVV